jgi:anti-sigma factor RsiW
MAMNELDTQSCDAARISAYYDGELSPAAASDVEAHLARCATCQRELEGWRTLSRRLGVLSDAPLPEAVRARLRQPDPYRSQRVLYRMAWGTTVSAAAAMVIGAVCLWQIGGETARADSSPAEWAVVASAGGPDLQAGETRSGDSPETQLATWMLDGLSKE